MQVPFVGVIKFGSMHFLFKIYALTPMISKKRHQILWHWLIIPCWVSDRYGGRWSLDLNGRGINQDNASDNQRLAVDAGYQIPFTMSLGLVTTLWANIHGDMYLIDDAQRKIQSKIIMIMMLWRGFFQVRVWICASHFRDLVFWPANY